MPSSNGAVSTVKNDTGFVIRADGPLAIDNPTVVQGAYGAIERLSRRSVLPTVDVEYNFGFFDRESYWTNEIAARVQSLVDRFNTDPDRQTDGVSVDSNAVLGSIRSRFDDAFSNAASGIDGSSVVAFTAQWPTSTFVELFLAAEAAGGGNSLTMQVPAIFGGTGGAGSDVFVEIGRRAEETGQYYIITRSTPRLGTPSENEAIQVMNFYVVDGTGAQTRQSSTITYSFRTTAGGGIEPEYEQGVTIISAPNGTGGNINTGAFESVTDLNKYVEGFSQAYKANCFVAGTRILLADGTSKNIEDIRIGDHVFAFDEGDPFGPLAEDVVVRTFRSHAPVTVKVGSLRGTPNHPVLSGRGIFRALGEIASEGSGFVDSGGSLLSINDIDELSEDVEVFNFQTRRYNTYVAEGIRVHNQCLHLDGTDGFVTFDSQGNALGLFFTGSDGLKIADYRHGQATARLTEIDRNKISHLVWEDIDQGYYGTEDVPSELSAINQPLRRDAITQQILIDAYAQDQQRLAEINYAGSIGSVVGGALGSYLFGDNPLERIIGSTVFSVVGENLSEFVSNSFSFNARLKLDTSRTILSDFGSEFLSAGIGAVSSYLVSELISVVGVDGFPGEILNSAAGSVIGKILENLSGISGATGPFSGIDPLMLGNAVGAFLGAKLASEIVSFDTVGGQLGSAIGSSLGVIGMSSFVVVAEGASIASATLFGAELGAFAGPVAALIGAFLGTILGGLIGSVFGGTPRSGADVTWDEATSGFVVANVYAKKGGSKEAARSMALTVAETFNGILAATGGVLLNPGAVQAGNYGMRKKDYVYRPYSTRDTDAITARFKGKDGANKLVGYGIFQGLTDPEFKIMGGDIYVKRALYNSISNMSASDFDANALTGNIAVAQRYETYLANSSTVNALIAAEPNSVFTAEWAIIFTRAIELGLTRRHAADWYGGYNLLLNEAQTNAANVAFAFNFDASADRLSRIVGLGDFVLGDSIDIAGQTVIDGTASADTIQLSATQLVAASGATNAGLTVDGAAHNGAARDIDVAATIDAGDGNDIVHASDRGDNVFGGAGNDTLYGGRLDDWLMGGDGNDVIHAGSQAGGLGGDGNYLDGGDGDDQLNGREGSDWLEGGDGTDTLFGGAGGDILAGGAGDGDMMKGGAGDDHYLFREGDGADTAEDEAGAPPAAPGLDPLRVRLAGLAAGTIARDWIGEGDWMPSQSAPSGSTPINAGEDRLVLGAGIGLENVRLSRGGTLAGTTEDDLVLELTDGAGTPTGDRLLMKGWYDSYKRIEWLQFADGQAIRIGDFQTFIAGTAGNDTIIGTQGRDFAVGGPGDDWMSLLGGDDVGVGGSGKDWVSGDGDNDLLVGGADDDRVLGGWGDDTLSGDGGDDEVEGGLGSDVLAGGLGNDFLTGGAGDDIFRFNRGDGHDTVMDTLAGTWEAIMAWNATAGRIDYVNGFSRDANNRVVRGSEMVFDGTEWIGRVQFDGSQLTHLVADPAGRVAQDATQAGELGDALEFGLGINIQDLMLAQYGWDLYLGISGENANTESFASLTDHVRLADWYRDGNRPIERFVFAATGVLDTQATNLEGGTDAADTVEGASGADWLTGNGGDDTLRGFEGKDILNGNAGSDLVEGGADDDVLYGGAGNDVLDGGAGADILVGGDGGDTASYASASAAVAAYLGASSFNSGDARGDAFHGIEDLTGSANNDFALGGDEGDNMIAGGAGNDNLFGGACDDTYVWNAWDYGDTIDDRPYVIEEIVNAAGELAAGYTVSWTQTYKKAPTPPGQPQRYYWQLTITAPDGEVVYGYPAYAPPEANPPIPVPSAYVQSGWLNGFSRVLNGASNGQQVARQKFDAQADGGELDTLEMGQGITLADLTFEQTGADLVVRYQNNAYNFVRIKNQTNTNAAIEWLQLADGLAVSLASLQIVGVSGVADGTTGNDLIVGRLDAADTLRGGDGDDTLSGLTGDDNLQGGAGDDVIEGGAGADIIDGGANNAIGSSETAGDTVRYVGSTAVTIDLRNTTTGQAGGDAAGDVLTGIENVVGSQAGNDSLTGDEGDNRLFGLGGSDTLTGLGGKDVLIGDEGDDTLHGGDGEDNLAGNEGADQLWGGNDNDIMAGGAGDDLLRGEAGNDELVGDDGADDLDGGAGNDKLTAGSGNDLLKGGDGDDTLTGDTGNDRLEGGAGNDIYTFSATSGEDLIIDAWGLNDLVFDETVDHKHLWLTRISGSDDLKISVIGGAATITVEDFFAASNASLVRTLQVSGRVLYLNHSDSLNLVADMTTASPTVPASMPQAISDKLDIYWHVGGKAAPRAAPISIATDEDVAVSISDLGVIDHDRSDLEYAITGTPERGTISGFDPETGAFTYTPNSNVNGTDRLTIVVRDADGHSTEIPIEIAIGAINDAPEDIGVDGGGSLSILEGVPGSPTGAGTVVGQLAALDPEGDEIFWELIDGAGGRFGLTNEGLLVVVAPELLNHSQATSHDIIVRARDGHGAYRDATLTIAVGNIGEVPNVPETSEERGAVDESFGGSGPALADSWVARFALSDPDGPTPTLRLVSNPASRFKIVGNEVRFADGSELDFETLHAAWQAGDSSITVADGDGDGRLEAVLSGSVEAFDGLLTSPASTTFTMAIEDVNEANSLSPTLALSVDENIAAGTIIGTVTATDTDLAGTAFAQQRYYFWDGTTISDTSVDGRYKIDALTGRISVNAALDHEAPNPSTTYAVVARDNQGAPGFHQAQTQITISISNLNEANSLGAVAPISVDENVAADTLLATVTASDLDSPSTQFGRQVYAFLVNGAASSVSGDGRYRIDAASGEIRVNSSLSYESGSPSATYAVIARDNEGVAPYLQAETQVVIGIRDLNEAPTAIDWTASVASLAERDRVASGTALPAITIGMLNVIDPDTAGSAFATYSYSVSDDRFEMIGNVLRLKLGAVLDYEAEAFDITVTATDGSLNPFSIQRTIRFAPAGAQGDIAISDAEDVLEGGAGDDHLVGQRNRDRLYGNGGDDVIEGGAGDDVIDGGAGADRLHGGTGDDTLSAGGDDASTNYLFGDDGNDSLIGGAGADVLAGGSGADHLDGGGGDDWVDYRYLNDGVLDETGVTVDLLSLNLNTGLAAGDSYSNVEHFHGSHADDVLRGSEVTDRFYGSYGGDVLQGRGGDDHLEGNDGDDQLYGDAGADTLEGGDGDDIIYGGAGSDTLLGGAGMDQLHAESGDDYLDGGAGNDILEGGEDNDIYIMDRSSDADTIHNYDSSGENIDVIGFRSDTADGPIKAEELWFERVGDDLKISILGTGSSALVKNWFVDADVESRANYKIDFLVADDRLSTTINLEGLVELMAPPRVKPASLAEHLGFLEDPDYQLAWENYWQNNKAPALSEIDDQNIYEDSVFSLAFTATDNPLPAAGVRMSAELISGADIISSAALADENIFSAPDANGQRTLNITPIANASGTARIRITATDPGGLTTSREFTLTVDPIADPPTITEFAGGQGTAGQAGDIALTLNVIFPDPDEVHEIRIAGVPLGVTLNLGARIGSSDVWKLSSPTAQQLDNLKVIAPAGWSQDLSLTATAYSSEAGQTAQSQQATTTVVINAPPTNITFSGTVNENAANGTTIGSLVGSDPDAGDNLTYSFAPLGNAGGRFALTASGVLSVENASLLDFENASAHAITVRVTDSFGQWIERNLSVTINNLNEANSLPGSYSFAVNENVAVGASVGTVAASDVDSSASVYGQQRYYFLNGSTASATSSDGRYLIDAVTGVITTNAALNFEAGSTSGAYTVIARDNQGAAGYNQISTSVTVGIANLNEANSLPGSYGFAVNENVAVGTSVGTVAASDLDSSGHAFGQQRYYFLNGSTASGTSSDGRYVIDAVTGVITTNAALNFEVGSTSGIYTVIARDNQGAAGYNQASTSVTIGITNLNEANSLPGSYSFAVNENVAVGTSVGTVAASDVDSASVAFGQQRYYFLNGSTASGTSSDGRYQINATTGQITTASALNFESGTPSVAYTVIARDNTGAAGYNQVSTSVTIGITNLNEANSLPGSYSFAVNENVAVGTSVGTVAASDVDSASVAFGQQRYYFLNGSTASATSSDGRYVIDAISGAIRTNSALDFEAGSPSVAYTVVARDNQGAAGYNQVSTSVTIGINNLNEANSLSSSHVFSVNENMAAGTAVGTVVASDIDSAAVAFGQQRYYFWNGSVASGTSSDGRYVIDATTGTIRTNAVFNYEVDPHSSYTVIARDNLGSGSYNQASTTVYLNLVNVNEAPTISGQTVSIAEQPANPLLPLITLSWGDVDGTPANGHVFSIVSGNAGGYWQIDNAGRISAIRTLNYEDTANRNFTLRVRVTDQAGAGLSTEADISVSLTNVNEAPTMSSTGTSWGGLVNANTQVGILSPNDPDVGDTLTYQVANVWNEDFGTGSPSNYRVTLVGGQPKVFTNTAHGGQWQNHEYITVRVTDSGGYWSETTFVVQYNTSRPRPPVVLDLDGDGLELVSKAMSNVHVDMDGDGVLDRTGWVAGDDGFLALDRNGDGIVTDMGETSFISDVPGSVSDMEGLRAFDTNENGLLDADDEAFASFMVWQDLNQDGISQTGEIRTLAQSGIAYINLTLNLTGENPENMSDNIVYATGEYGRDDGTIGLVGDVMLAYEPSNVQIAPPIIIDLDGNGVTTTELAANPALFDMDGDGVLDRTGWVGAADGLLALDRNGDGVIRGISEISFVGDLEGARTDLEGLVAFDSNRDGQLSGTDTKFGDFRVWIDANRDGVSDAGELKRLAEVGIVSIALSGEATGAPSVPGRNVIYNETTFLRGDGTNGIVGDVGLAFIGSKTGSGTTGENRATPESYSFGSKSSRYQIETSGGGVYVRGRAARGVVDAAAGGISGASMLDFSNGAYGLAAAVVIDFDLDGLELRKRKKSDATFDMNADGTRDDTGWINHNEALLVLDRNGNGIVDGTGEISFVGDREGAKTGLEGLLAFDSNRDGVLSAKDARFAEFRIWRDRNGDGRSDTGELYSLTDIGIASIELDRRAFNGQWKPGSNIVVSTSTFTRIDGRTGTVGDVALAYKPSAAPSAPVAGSNALNALRRGLNGWQFDRPIGFHMADPFDWDASPDATANEADDSGAPMSQDIYQRRLAFAVQEMASFGRAVGEGDHRDRLQDHAARFDYFAA
jgi:Ca2+-binding RTX toxin-like protein